jgi:hypothetical protein
MYDENASFYELTKLIYDMSNDKKDNIKKTTQIMTTKIAYAHHCSIISYLGYKIYWHILNYKPTDVFVKKYFGDNFFKKYAYVRKYIEKKIFNEKFIWEPLTNIPTFEIKKFNKIKNLYEVNQYGFIRKIKSKKPCRFRTHGKSDRFDSSIRGYDFPPHRICYCAFNSIPLESTSVKSGYVIAHEDENSLNNHISNLKLETRSNNTKAACKEGAGRVLPNRALKIIAESGKDNYFYVNKTIHKELGFTINKTTYRNRRKDLSWAEEREYDIDKNGKPKLPFL